jgi:hypothetical protein
MLLHKAVFLGLSQLIEMLINHKLKSWHSIQFRFQFDLGMNFVVGRFLIG